MAEKYRIFVNYIRNEVYKLQQNPDYEDPDAFVKIFKATLDKIIPETYLYHFPTNGGTVKEVKKSIINALLHIICYPNETVDIKPLTLVNIISTISLMKEECKKSNEKENHLMKPRKYFDHMLQRIYDDLKELHMNAYRNSHDEPFLHRLIIETASKYLPKNMRSNTAVNALHHLYGAFMNHCSPDKNSELIANTDPYLIDALFLAINDIKKNGFVNPKEGAFKTYISIIDRVQTDISELAEANGDETSLFEDIAERSGLSVDSIQRITSTRTKDFVPVIDPNEFVDIIETIGEINAEKQSESSSNTSSLDSASVDELSDPGVIKLGFLQQAYELTNLFSEVLQNLISEVTEGDDSFPEDPEVSDDCGCGCQNMPENNSGCNCGNDCECNKSSSTEEEVQKSDDCTDDVMNLLDTHYKEISLIANNFGLSISDVVRTYITSPKMFDILYKEVTQGVDSLNFDGRIHFKEPTTRVESSESD